MVCKSHLSKAVKKGELLADGAGPSVLDAFSTVVCLPGRILSNILATPNQRAQWCWGQSWASTEQWKYRVTWWACSQPRSNKMPLSSPGSECPFCSPFSASVFFALPCFFVSGFAVYSGPHDVALQCSLVFPSTGLWCAGRRAYMCQVSVLRAWVTVASALCSVSVLQQLILTTAP